MGAMSVLMYVVHSRVFDIEHHLNSVILLSPAGIHRTAPMVAKILGPIMSFSLKIGLPYYSYRIPSIYEYNAYNRYTTNAYRKNPRRLKWKLCS